jgi:hypothetical protein
VGIAFATLAALSFAFPGFASLICRTDPKFDRGIAYIYTIISALCFLASLGLLLGMLQSK